MNALKKTKRAIEREAPMLMTLTGISGFITSTILAVKATPTAISVMEENEDELPESGYGRIFEMCKLLLPVYGPAVGMTLISTAFVLGSQHISNRRYAAVSTLYLASQQYLGTLQEKIIEEVGEKKFQKIRAAASAPKEDPPETLIISSDEQVLFYDTYSARYFKAPNVEDIRRKINDLNAVLFRDMFVSINDFYYDIGLDPVMYGDDVGWAIEGGSIDIRLDSALTKTHRPCVTITFEAVPKHIYDRLAR